SLGESLTHNLAAGSYRLVVKSHGNYGDVGQYTVTGTLPDAYENNDTRLTAADLGVAPGIQVSALNIDSAGDDDWYRFTLNAASSIDVSALFSHSAGNLDLQVTDATGTVLVTANSVTNNELTQLANLTAGTYYVRVFGVSGATNQYSLSILTGALPLDLIAPRVTGVTLVGGGSQQSQYAVPAGDGAQLATVPVGQVSRIRVSFSEAVTVDQNDLVVAGTGGPYAFSGFGFDPFTNTAIWVLANPVAADEITLTLNADGASPVTDLAGNRLDGEWDNPSSVLDPASSNFPSGDGEVGGNFVFKLQVLPGDANRDGAVDGADYTSWADHYLQNGGWAQGDFNDDGIVDGSDYTIWADNFLVSLPAAVPDGGGAEESQAITTTGDPAASTAEALTFAAAASSLPLGQADVEATPALAAQANPEVQSLNLASASPAAPGQPAENRVTDNGRTENGASESIQLSAVAVHLSEGRPWHSGWSGWSSRAVTAELPDQVWDAVWESWEGADEPVDRAAASPARQRGLQGGAPRRLRR
ncbi:MAG: pre-peptidase C-terminal domain-containing protein, partial [Planctomycetaceae bacterium]|nr:pre-peptidase C-terminal domain-containing protein [Planctomycetaceae bacterium]